MKRIKTPPGKDKRDDDVKLYRVDEAVLWKLKVVPGLENYIGQDIISYIYTHIYLCAFFYLPS